MSTRMGRKKELLPFRGRPLLLVAAECLLGMGYDVYLLASPRDADRISAVAGGRFRVLIDKYDLSTPLNGLRSLLDAANGCAFLLGGDSPFVSRGLIEDSLDLCERGFQAVLPMWAGGRVDTVHAAYSSSLLGPLEDMLSRRSPDLSMARLISSASPIAFLEAERYWPALGDADTAMEMSILERMYNGRGCALARGPRAGPGAGSGGRLASASGRARG